MACLASPVEKGSEHATLQYIRELKQRLSDLDGKRALLLQLVEIGCKENRHQLAQLQQEIATVAGVLHDCQLAFDREQAARMQQAMGAGPVESAAEDTIQKFIADFRHAVPSMAPRAVVGRAVSNSVMDATWASINGDGNCGPRAFLTSLALVKFGLLLPHDPQGMLDWVLRMKLLMAQHMMHLISAGVLSVSDLLTIPENGRIETLDEYFAKFMSNGYFLTNFEFQVLATMFDAQINIIRETPTDNETFQMFAPFGDKFKAVRDGQINIMFQGQPMKSGHYVVVVKILRWKGIYAGLQELQD